MTAPVPLLVARGLTAGYGKLDILHDVSLAVNVDEIVATRALGIADRAYLYLGG